MQRATIWLIASWLIVTTVARSLGVPCELCKRFAAKPLVPLPTPRFQQHPLVLPSTSEPSSLERLLELRGGMTTQKAWAILFGATLFELVSTGLMHKAEGFSKLRPALLSVVFYGASFYSFNLSLRALEISVAYAVWSSVVMAALSAIGMMFLGEVVTRLKLIGIGSIIIGTVCLSLNPDLK